MLLDICVYVTTIKGQMINMKINKDPTKNIMKIESKLIGFDGWFCFGYVNAFGQYLHYFDEIKT